MPGKLLAHAHDGQAIRTRLRRQIEVDDLGKLAREQRHEDFIERDTQHRGLIGRFARIGRVIDRIAAHGDALDGQDRITLDLVVVAGMVAKRAFKRIVARMDHTLEHDFGARWHAQVRSDAACHLGATAAQKPGKLVLRQRVGNRRHRPQNRGRVGTQGNNDRKGLTRVGLAVVEVVERPATMRQPAHDDPIGTDHLLSIDAQVQTLTSRAAGNRQAPGDEWPGVPRPAGLYRQTRQIDIGAFPDDLLARRCRHHFRCHVEHPTKERNLVPGIAQASRRLGLLQLREQFANAAQRVDRIGSHAQRDPPRRAEQIAQHRDAMAGGVLEEDGRPACTQHTVADLGHLEAWRHLGPHTHEFPHRLESGNEVAQVAVLHESRSNRC